MMTWEETETLKQLTAQKYMIDLLAFIDFDLEKKFGSGGRVILSIASESLGKHILNLYTRAWRVSTWTPELLGKAMVDLKDRIGGHAKLVSVSRDKIVLKSTKCEFGDDTIRELQGNLCQVCASVFGAMVKASGISTTQELPSWESRIASGSEQCLVVTKLMP